MRKPVEMDMIFAYDMDKESIVSILLNADNPNLGRN